MRPEKGKSQQSRYDSVSERWSPASSWRTETEHGGMSEMGAPLSCPHFIPEPWPAALRSAPQYKPDTLNRETFSRPSCKSITSPLIQIWNKHTGSSECMFVLTRLRCCGGGGGGGAKKGKS